MRIYLAILIFFALMHTCNSSDIARALMAENEALRKLIQLASSGKANHILWDCVSKCLNDQSFDDILNLTTTLPPASGAVTEEQPELPKDSRENVAPPKAALPSGTTTLRPNAHNRNSGRDHVTTATTNPVTTGTSTEVASTTVETTTESAPSTSASPEVQEIPANTRKPHGHVVHKTRKIPGKNGEDEFEEYTEYIDEPAVTIEQKNSSQTHRKVTNRKKIPGTNGEDQYEEWTEYVDESGQPVGGPSPPTGHSGQGTPAQPHGRRIIHHRRKKPGTSTPDQIEETVEYLDENNSTSTNVKPGTRKQVHKIRHHPGKPGEDQVEEYTEYVDEDGNVVTTTTTGTTTTTTASTSTRKSKLDTLGDDDQEDFIFTTEKPTSTKPTTSEANQPMMSGEPTTTAATTTTSTSTRKSKLDTLGDDDQEDFIFTSPSTEKPTSTKPTTSEVNQPMMSDEPTTTAQTTTTNPPDLDFGPDGSALPTEKPDEEPAATRPTNHKPLVRPVGQTVPEDTTTTSQTTTTTQQPVTTSTSKLSTTTTVVPGTEADVVTYEEFEEYVDPDGNVVNGTRRKLDEKTTTIPHGAPIPPGFAGDRQLGDGQFVPHLSTEAPRERGGSGKVETTTGPEEVATTTSRIASTAAGTQPGVREKVKPDKTTTTTPTTGTTTRSRISSTTTTALPGEVEASRPDETTTTTAATSTATTTNGIPSTTTIAPPGEVEAGKPDETRTTTAPTSTASTTSRMSSTTTTAQPGVQENHPDKAATRTTSTTPTISITTTTNSIPSTATTARPSVTEEIDQDKPKTTTTASSSTSTTTTTTTTGGVPSTTTSNQPDAQEGNNPDRPTTTASTSTTTTTTTTTTIRPADEVTSASDTIQHAHVPLAEPSPNQNPPTNRKPIDPVPEPFPATKPPETTRFLKVYDDVDECVLPSLDVAKDLEYPRFVDEFQDQGKKFEDMKRWVDDQISAQEEALKSGPDCQLESDLIKSKAMRTAMKLIEDSYILTKRLRG